MEEDDNWPERCCDHKLKSRPQDDTLLVTLEVPDDGCKGFTGDIKIKGDSLILVYKPKRQGCKELIFYSLHYKILNTKKINYKLSYEKM